jgi:solute carrier family 25 carnitine/acylcarnitine transporter 20/29
MVGRDETLERRKHIMFWTDRTDVVFIFLPTSSLDLTGPCSWSSVLNIFHNLILALHTVVTPILGQPFDIVKVRLQTSTQYPSALSAARSILANEGASAFYKGTLTPLLGIGACVSVQFGAFHAARRWFEERNAATSKPLQLGYGQYYAAGAFAGLANSAISGPIEHVRIRLQAQPHGAGRLYSGPLDCVRKLMAGGGLFKGLYRGEAVTVLREAQAYGVWFMTFEWLMNGDAARNGVARKDIATWKVAFYGGLAGEALWLSSYPFDVIKSKMQTDGFGKDSKYSSMRDAFAKTWRAEGMRGFWKGLGPTLLRAMPVSAGTFAVVELTMRAIN